MENRNNRSNVKQWLTHKALIIAVSALGLYALTGFFLAPYLIARYVPKTISAKLDRNVQLGKVRVNPFLLTLESNAFRLDERDGSPIAGYQRLFIDFQLSSLFRWAWTFKTVALERPVIHGILAKDGSLNLVRLVPASGSGAGDSGEAEVSEAEGAGPPRMIVHDLSIQEGEIQLIDQRLSVPAEIRLSPLNIRLKEISTLPEREGPYSLAAVTADGESVQWVGEIALHPFKSSGRFSFDNIRAATLWQFARDELSLAAPRGLLSLDAGYVLDLSGLQPKIAFNDVSFRLSGLSLQRHGDAAPFFELAETDISASRIDLQARRIKIEAIGFSGGQGRLRVDENGILNVSTLMSAKAAPPEKAAPEPQAPAVPQEANSDEPPWSFQVDEITFHDLAVEYEDLHQTPALNAGIANIEGRLQLTGTTGGSSDLNIDQLNFDLGDVWIRNPESSVPEAALSRLALQEGYLRVGARDLGIAKILLQGGDFHISRGADGKINLVQLLMPDRPRGDSPPSAAPAAEIDPWRFLLKTVQLIEFNADFTDQSVKPDEPLLYIENLQGSVDTIDGKSPMHAHVLFGVREGGKFDINGEFDPSAGTAEAELLINDLHLPLLQPYVKPYVNLRLARGAFSGSGKWVYGGERKTPQMGFQGGFAISGLQLLEADTDNLFFGWEHLKTSNLNFSLQPNRLEIEDVLLSRMDGKMIIAEDGSVNVSEIVKKSEGEAPAEPKAGASENDAGEAFPIALRKLRIADSNLFFADYSLTPQFAARIHQLNGSVVGLSSAPGARAEIQLDGRVDDYGVSKISGEIEGFDPKSFTNIAVVFRNLEMTRLTPYSGKFVGRKIDSGKLSLDLKYYVENGKLKGDNQIVVDRIILGERVESPQAVSLPLNLAIALLEDSNGIIDIGLPVKGDLENPEFSFGPLIWKALVNVIKKIASAPFRALGALLGGGNENLDRVAFEAGRSDIPPPEIEKLRQLAEAMKQRPNLKLVVQGGYSEAKDGQTLREVAVRRALAQRMGAILDESEDPGPVDYSDPKVMEALRLLSAERLGEPETQPAAAGGGDSQGTGKEGQPEPTSAEVAAQDPRLISQQMFARLVAHEPLNEARLTELAHERARHVMEELVLGGLNPERMAAEKNRQLAPEKPVTVKLDLTSMR